MLSLSFETVYSENCNYDLENTVECNETGAQRDRDRQTQTQTDKQTGAQTDRVTGRRTSRLRRQADATLITRRPTCSQLVRDALYIDINVFRYFFRGGAMV